MPACAEGTADGESPAGGRDWTHGCAATAAGSEVVDGAVASGCIVGKDTTGAVVAPGWFCEAPASGVCWDGGSDVSESLHPAKPASDKRSSTTTERPLIVSLLGRGERSRAMETEKIVATAPFLSVESAFRAGGYQKSPFQPRAVAGNGASRGPPTSCPGRTLTLPGSPWRLRPWRDALHGRFTGAPRKPNRRRKASLRPRPPGTAASRRAAGRRRWIAGSP